jgi:transposase-like protein
MSQGTTHRKYTNDFKSQAVELSMQPGMSVSRAAADLGIPVNALYRWKKELAEKGHEAFRGPGQRSAVQTEELRLKRENAELRMQLDILKKATAFFARNQR